MPRNEQNIASISANHNVNIGILYRRVHKNLHSSERNNNVALKANKCDICLIHKFSLPLHS